ncbi:MAG TPA: hypothetical protein VK421_07380 [Pyrinomonadaceae bacterium]|nr:hypothetical protein [Pyrinomonadaceae bacterium]
MPGSPNARRFVSVVLLLAAYCLVAAAIASAQAQAPPRGHSDSDARGRDPRRQRAPLGTEPPEILRNARTVFVEPNRHVKAEYLEYKLDKLPEFSRWRLAFVTERDKADLVIRIDKAALNYIFSVVEPESSIVVAKGKVVAVNGLAAAEDISHRIVRRMREVRALPTDEP